MALEHGMIEPFADRQMRNREPDSFINAAEAPAAAESPRQPGALISYGLSSYGYDLRVSDEFKVFTNVFNTVVDPKEFDPQSFVDMRTDVCIVPPNSFALARSVEYFQRDALRAGMGGARHAGNLQHHAPARAHLRQRGVGAGDFPPGRERVRGVLRRPRGQVHETTRYHRAAAFTGAPPAGATVFRIDSIWTRCSPMCIAAK